MWTILLRCTRQRGHRDEGALALRETASRSPPPLSPRADSDPSPSPRPLQARRAISSHRVPRGRDPISLGQGRDVLRDLATRPPTPRPQPLSPPRKVRRLRPLRGISLQRTSFTFILLSGCESYGEYVTN
eukprot:scaffold18997_cov28-Tisochrysis_lutea.AAC.1